MLLASQASAAKPGRVAVLDFESAVVPGYLRSSGGEMQEVLTTEQRVFLFVLRVQRAERRAALGVAGGLSGPDSARDMRLQYPDPPILLCGGHAPVASQVHGDGFEIIAKPYSADSLAQALRRSMKQGARAGRTPSAGASCDQSP